MPETFVLSKPRFIDSLVEITPESITIEGARIFSPQDQSFPHINSEIVPSNQYTNNHQIPFVLVIPPVRQMIKWSPVKSRYDLEYHNISLPWQTIVYLASYNFNSREYSFNYGTAYHLLSHKNPLFTKGLETPEGRSEFFKMSFMPNVSPSGHICLGETLYDQWSCPERNNDLYINLSLSPEEFFKIFPSALLKYYDCFITGVFNPDYSSPYDFLGYHADSENYRDEYDDDDDYDYGRPPFENWINPNWSIKRVLDKRFYANLHPNPAYASEFSRYLVSQTFWKSLFS